MKIHEQIQTPKNPGTTVYGGNSPITVGDIRNALAYIDDNVKVSFGGTLEGIPLKFYRFKWRGENLFQFELNEDR